MKRLLRLAAAVLLLAGFTSAASAALLTELLDGGVLVQGDKIFSDFSWSGSSGPEGISITGIGDGSADNLYGIQIGGPLGQVGPGSSSWTLGYTVTAGEGFLISDIHQYANLSGSIGGSATITELAFDPSGAQVANSTIGKVLTELDLTDPPAELNDVLDLANPLQKVIIRKTITLSVPIDDPTGHMSATIIQQRFSQVPEPTTIIAGALLLLPLGASSLRILRKNRKA